MKCDKYMGMDVHQAMTVVVVLDADGRVILETMVPTEAAAIIRLVQSLHRPLRVTFEESTQAAWLYEVIRAYVTDPRPAALFFQRRFRSAEAAADDQRYPVPGIRTVRRARSVAAAGGAIVVGGV